MQFSMQSVLGMVILFALSTVNGQCPADQACFYSPENCGVASGTECEIWALWKANGTDAIDFQMGTKLTTTDRWLAIGFSNDTKMGDDDIWMCNSVTITVDHYKSVVQVVEKDNVAKDPAGDGLSKGLSNVVVASVDGFLHCNFTRKITVTDVDSIFDLSKTEGADMTPVYYYFFGSGPITSGVPLEHEHDPYVSSAKVDYSMVGDVGATASNGSSSESHSSEEGDGGSANMAASILLVMLVSSIAMFFK